MNTVTKATIGMKADNGLTYTLSGFAVVNEKGEVVTEENKMSKFNDARRFQPLTFNQKWVAKKVAEGLNGK